MAERYGGTVSGVIAMCTDVPVTVATVAAVLKLPGLPLEVAQLGADKLAMKERLQAAGIPTAWGCVLESAVQLGRLIKHRGGALVIKPVDSRGARGVFRIAETVNYARTIHNLQWAFTEAQHQSPTGRVMVEEWLNGPQVSTETVLLPSGLHATPGFLDRNYARLDEFAPYVIEDGAEGPSRLAPDEQSALKALAYRAAYAVVGGVPCTVKGDLVLTPSGPKVIELALRLSGGGMSTHLVPAGTGVDLIGAAIRLALGEPVALREVTPSTDFGAAVRFVFPRGKRPTNHTERGQACFGYGPTREEAVDFARAKVATHD